MAALRYFKYEYPGKVSEKFNREELNLMDAKGKRTHRKNQFIEVMSLVVFIVVIAVFITAAILLTKPLVNLVKEKGLVKNLLHCARGLIIAVVSAGSLALAGFILIKINKCKTTEVSAHEKRREAMQYACGILREYYGFSSPFLVTKCYDSTVPTFIERDVCLFFVEGKLRITADIYNGFANGYKDCGCYEFEEGEEEIEKTTEGGREVCVLYGEGTYFYLSKRAATFINKCRESQKNSDSCNNDGNKREASEQL